MRKIVQTVYCFGDILIPISSITMATNEELLGSPFQEKCKYVQLCQPMT